MKHFRNGKEGKEDVVVCERVFRLEREWFCTYFESVDGTDTLFFDPRKIYIPFNMKAIILHSLLPLSSLVFSTPSAPSSTPSSTTTGSATSSKGGRNSSRRMSSITLFEGRGRSQTQSETSHPVVPTSSSSSSSSASNVPLSSSNPSDAEMEKEYVTILESLFNALKHPAQYSHLCHWISPQMKKVDRKIAKDKEARGVISLSFFSYLFSLSLSLSPLFFLFSYFFFHFLRILLKYFIFISEICLYVDQNAIFRITNLKSEQVHGNLLLQSSAGLATLSKDFLKMFFKSVKDDDSLWYDPTGSFRDDNENSVTHLIAINSATLRSSGQRMKKNLSFISKGRRMSMAKLKRFLSCFCISFLFLFFFSLFLSVSFLSF